MTPSDILSAILIGAGNRGKDVYGSFALSFPEKLKFIAVAEPNPKRRKQFSEAHQISPEMQFETWEQILDSSVSKIADTAFICTQDQMHTKPAYQALSLGYHVLLEKPMATTLNECVTLVKISKDKKLQLRIAHVLRYNDFFDTIFKTIKSGKIGEIVTIDHRENVSYFHFAHSFVRGNWAIKETSSPIILAKSCHDFDILHWLVGSNAKFISSFGNLLHFNYKNLPINAPQRCTDGCSIEDSCKYYAPRIYIEIVPLLRIASIGGTGMAKFISHTSLNHPRLFNILKRLIPAFKQVQNYQGWPVSTITDDLTLDGKLIALKDGPYGRCVYRCDNNQPDHIVTIIEFENGITATFTMHGFSHIEGRTIRIDGTKGTLLGEALASGDKIVLYNHLKGSKDILLNTKMNIDPVSGHGGGDSGLIHSFIHSIHDNMEIDTLTSAEASLEGHLMAFASEKSRNSKEVIDLESMRPKL